MSSRAAEHRRDAGLARVGRTSRWITVGAVALIGVVSAAVAHSLPGRSTTSSSSSGTPATNSTTIPSSNPFGSAPGLQAPSQAPSNTVPASPPARVLSGGS